MTQRPRTARALCISTQHAPGAMLHTAVAESKPSAKPLKSLGNGGPTATNLEPATLNSVLDSLEEWERYIATSPELFDKLQEISTSPAEARKSPAGTFDVQTYVKAPKLSGPS